MGRPASHFDNPWFKQFICSVSPQDSRCSHGCSLKVRAKGLWPLLLRLRVQRAQPLRLRTSRPCWGTWRASLRLWRNWRMSCWLKVSVLFVLKLCLQTSTRHKSIHRNTDLTCDWEDPKYLTSKWVGPVHFLPDYKSQKRVWGHLFWVTKDMNNACFHHCGDKTWFSSRVWPVIDFHLVAGMIVFLFA